MPPVPMSEIKTQHSRHSCPAKNKNSLLPSVHSIFSSSRLNIFLSGYFKALCLSVCQSFSYSVNSSFFLCCHSFMGSRKEKLFLNGRAIPSHLLAQHESIMHRRRKKVPSLKLISIQYIEYAIRQHQLIFHNQIKAFRESIKLLS